MTDFTADGALPARSPVPQVLHQRSPDLMSAMQPHSYLLLLRFAVFNMVAFALVGAAWLQGWVDTAVFSDRTGQCQFIVAVFLVGLAICAAKVWRTSMELNACKDLSLNPDSRAARYVAETRGMDSGARALIAGNLRLKLSSRIGVVRNVANALVMLGLIGTVVGFIIALSGVEADKAGDVAAIGPMVSKLIEGMGVALYTTLVGSLLNMWLTVNHNILATGTVNLLTDIIGLGERHAGA